LGEDGTVYVVEAGNAGDDIGMPPATADATAVGGSPVAAEDAEPLYVRGDSGQVTMIAPDGTQSVVVTGLPSYGGIGPFGIVDTGDTLWVSIGGGAAGGEFFASLAGVDATIEPLEFENSVVKIDKASGEVSLVAELGSNEVANNPDGTDINPNLTGLTLGPDGMLYVADGGGNVIYKVNPEDGTFEVALVVPSMQFLLGQEVPTSLEDIRQPVPMQVAFDADGGMYVIILSEEWEAPSILSVAADGTITGIGEPGQFMFSLTSGPDGTLYVTQGTTDFSGEMPAPGFVARLEADGTLTPMVEGLFVPFGNAVDADGNVYVTVNSIGFAPGDPPAGMLVKCEGAAAAG
jgi:outer membrane protein assembly factor BamB